MIRSKDTRDPNLVREHFRVNGVPKKKLEAEDATDLADELGVSAYRCTFCGWWHIGS